MVLTPKQAADLLSQPDVKIHLMGFLEAYCKVDTVQTLKGEPYQFTCKTGKVQQRRDNVLDTDGNPIPATSVVPFGIVRRHVKLSIRTEEYATALHNAQAKAGVEQSAVEPHKWAEQYNGSKIVYWHRDAAKRNGTYYLQVFLNLKSCVEVWSQLEDVNGNAVEFEQIKGIVSPDEAPDRREAKMRVQAESKGLAKEDGVFCRDFTINGIVKFSYAGQTYEVMPAARPAAVEGGEATVESEQPAAALATAEANA